MATYTVVANINNGDETTAPEDLIFKVYDGDVLIHTTGSANDDPNVSIQSNEVTIVGVPAQTSPNLIRVTAIDLAHNESDKSNYIEVGVTLFYESGFYEAGFYENAS
jgi:hypothetical protein